MAPATAQPWVTIFHHQHFLETHALRRIGAGVVGELRLMTEQIEKYLHFMDGMDIPHEQKLEVLRTLFYVMKGFVDRAFGLDPTQQALGYSSYLPSEYQADDLDFKDHTPLRKGEPLEHRPTE